MLAASGTDVATAFIELGGVVFVLSVLARFAGRIGVTAVPLYLVAGLAAGEGGIVEVGVGEDFISLGAEIGVLLLLLAIGLQYTDAELRSGLRSGLVPGLVDAALNAVPGFLFGLLLGWGPLAAVLLAGATWASSSGIIAKVLSDLGRLGNRETPGVLNLLVLEDLAMAVYLPVVAALIAGGSAASTVRGVVVAVSAVAVILLLALRWGHRFSSALAGGSDEALLLAVFGVTLLVAGLAQRIEVSGAIGAFLVGLALSGPVEERASQLIAPLRDLFAATFFLFFSLQINPADLVERAVPAAILAAITIATKVVTGWDVARRAGVGAAGRRRAGMVLTARGEFSIVIAALGAELADGDDLRAVVAAYVLITAIVGPLLAKYTERAPARSIPVRSVV